MDWSDKLPTSREELTSAWERFEIPINRNRITTAISVILTAILLYFVCSMAVPVLSDSPSDITPDTEPYSDSQLIGVGDIEGGYVAEEPSSADYVYQEKFEYNCRPSGERLTTGGSFNCDYRVVSIDGNETQGLVQFDRETLEAVGEDTIVAEWTRLSPENETTYVTHNYGFSEENSLNDTFQVYTPTEPGQYEFRLLLNSKLNPYGSRVNDSNVISSQDTELYVYSEEQSASFSVSESFYQLERIAVIGIIVAWIQLILSFYRLGR